MGKYVQPTEIIFALSKKKIHVDLSVTENAQFVDRTISTLEAEIDQIIGNITADEQMKLFSYWACLYEAGATIIRWFLEGRQPSAGEVALIGEFSKEGKRFRDLIRDRISGVTADSSEKLPYSIQFGVIMTGASVGNQENIYGDD